MTAAVYAVGALLYGLLASGEKQVIFFNSFFGKIIIAIELNTVTFLQPWADGEEGLIECEAEKGELRSDGDSYGATGGTQEQVTSLFFMCCC